MISGVVMYSQFGIDGILSGKFVLFASNLESMSRERSESLLGKLLKFTGLAAIAGVLATTLAVPAVVVAAIAGTAGLASFETLPSYIKPVTASQASTIFAYRNGKPVPVARFYNENRISVSYEQISPNFVNAVVSTEDPRYWQHAGVDVISLLRATGSNLAGGGGPGGSTITMQYVKNSLIEAAVIAGDQAGIEAARSRSFDRKIKEIKLALALEKQSNKKDIFAGYANLSYFGNNLNGIETASEYYFGTKAAKLTLPQAAMLAAMLKGPALYEPDIKANLDRAKGRRDYVIDNMFKAGYITQQQHDEAVNTPVTTNITHVANGCEANQRTAFFCDYAVWTIRNSPVFGVTPQDRENRLRQGGLKIFTTMDLKVQNATDKAVKKWVPSANKWNIGSASVSVEVGTGRILAMSENRVYDQTPSNKRGHTSVNYSSDIQYGGSSGFQVGSTYKIFTLADWLKNGHKLLDRVDGRTVNYDVASDFKASCGALGGFWEPHNMVREPVNPTVVQATAISENTAFANMASQLDLCEIRDTAMAFGVHRADGTALQFTPASILGTNEIAPMTIAAAMAAVANHGVFCSPVAIEKVVVNLTKEVLPVPPSTCTTAVDPSVAAGMTYAMKAVMSGGTGGQSSTNDGVPLAGKTGTTDSGIHTWMSGFSSKVATSTWVGNVSGHTTLAGITLNGMAGNRVRHEIWRSIMQTVNKEPSLRGGKLDEASPEMINTASVGVQNVAGQIPSDAQAHLKLDGLNSEVVTTPVAAATPIGTVAYTSPKAGSVIPAGAIVKIYVSKGGSLVVPDVRGMTVDNAKQAILAAGFPAASEPQASQTQYFVHSKTVPAGNVVGTTPKAGKPAMADSAILLIISLGP